VPPQKSMLSTIQQLCVPVWLPADGQLCVADECLLHAAIHLLHAAEHLLQCSIRVWNDAANVRCAGLRHSVIHWRHSSAGPHLVTCTGARRLI
jgi:hypothetical protein